MEGAGEPAGERGRSGHLLPERRRPTPHRLLEPRVVLHAAGAAEQPAGSYPGLAALQPRRPGTKITSSLSIYISGVQTF